MGENGMLKIGKVTDFQAHMLEHQLGAYTDCNHGQGLAVIHPVLYRHMLPEAAPQFARLAVNVWGVARRLRIMLRWQASLISSERFVSRGAPM